MENVIQISDHAYKRCQQRGIRPDLINFILEHADQILRAGQDNFAYLVSKRKLNQMLKIKEISPSVAEKIKGIELVGTDKFIVTVYHKTKRRRRDFKIKNK